MSGPPAEGGTTALRARPAAREEPPVARQPRRKVRREWVRQVVWLGPTALVILVVVLYPILEMIRTSFSEVSSSGVIRGANGLDNYAGLLARPELVPILQQTALWLTAVVAGTIVVAWPLAVFLNQQFPGRRWVRYAVLVPWAAALPMSALIFQWMFNFNYGVVNELLLDFGLIDQRVDWFGGTASSWVTLILLGVFVSVPFNTYILLAGLQAIPADIYEAARLDGAGRLRIWFDITRPMMKTSTFLAVILNIIGVFNSFALIWVLTRGGPGRTTQTTFTYMYDLAFGSRSLGQSAALSVFNLALLGVVVAVYLRVNRAALRDFR
jgi:multiple sugar transport system permease protein